MSFFHNIFKRKCIKLEEKHLVEKYKNESELPKHIRLDLCTLCQLKCPVCYMRKYPQDVKNGCGNGYLRFENFKKLVDANDIRSMEISNSGEIFLNPDLVKILAYANKKNIRVTADNGVNLNYITDEQAEALAKYRVVSMTISIDGASQETYSKYRIGGNFDIVIDNIEKINFFKRKYNNGCPHLVWKFIIFGHNEHEIEKAKQFADKLQMHLRFEANWDKEYSPIINKEKVLNETGFYNLDVNVSPVEQLEEYQKGIVNWYFCRDLWEPQINWDGRILGCCANFKEDFGGNVFSEGLLNALNRDKLVYAKNMVTNNAMPNKEIPCYRCWVYLDMQKKNKWLKSPKIEGKL